MAVTQNTYTGNGTTVLFSFTFPYLETTDIKVSVNGTNTTAYTLANATTVQFNTAPANGAAIRIYRETSDTSLAATFYPGSAIRSQDLNKNFDKALFIAQETKNITVQASTGNLADGSITNNLLANSAVTSSKVADGTVTTSKIADGAVTSAKLSEAYVTTSAASSTYAPQASPSLTGAIYANGSYRGNVTAVAALDIDCSLGNTFTKTINANSTFTVSNVPASRSYAFTLELTHTSGTITWFSGVAWPGGVAPTLTTGKVHLFMFFTDDGGTTWRASSLINY